MNKKVSNILQYNIIDYHTFIFHQYHTLCVLGMIK